MRVHDNTSGTRPFIAPAVYLSEACAGPCEPRHVWDAVIVYASVAAAAEQATELPIISRARSLQVRPLPTMFLRPRSEHQQKQGEDTMRGVVFTGERGLELMQFPDPTPDAHDVVIEMKASGMC